MGIANFSSAEKTAILLIGLGQDLAAEIMRHMDPHEVKRVGVAMSRLGKVDQETVDQIMVEFHQILMSDKPGLKSGGFQFAQKVLQQAFGRSDFGQNLIKDLKHSSASMSSLELTDADTIYRIIANEHPQTMALVIAHANPNMAGKIIQKLSEALKIEVIQRVTKMDRVAPELVQEVDDMIRKELEQIGLAGRKIGGADKAAAILNAMNNEREQILDTLEERDPDLTDSIRSHMFTFEDLAKLDDKSIQGLYKSVDSRIWVLALRNASNSLKNRIYCNLSKRAAQNLAEDIEALGPQPIKDVQGAQGDILQKAFDLEAQGVIILRQNQQEVV